MTTDERLNDLEDQIKGLKKIINHNNGIARKLNKDIKDQLTKLNTTLEEVKVAATAKNAGLGDIFGQGFPR